MIILSPPFNKLCFHTPAVRQWSRCFDGNTFHCWRIALCISYHAPSSCCIIACSRMSFPTQRRSQDATCSSLRHLHVVAGETGRVGKRTNRRCLEQWPVPPLGFSPCHDPWADPSRGCQAHPVTPGHGTPAAVHPRPPEESGRLRFEAGEALLQLRRLHC